MEFAFNKVYKLKCVDDKYDDYCKAIGLNAFKRSIAKKITVSTKVVKVDDENYEYHLSTPFKTIVQKFKLGEENEMTTMDGRRVKYTINIDGNTLTQKQVEPNRTVVIVEQYYEKEWLGVITCGDVVSKIKYVAVD